MGMSFGAVAGVGGSLDDGGAHVHYVDHWHRRRRDETDCGTDDRRHGLVNPLDVSSHSGTVCLMARPVEIRTQ